MSTFAYLFVGIWTLMVIGAVLEEIRREREDAPDNADAVAKRARKDAA